MAKYNFELKKKNCSRASKFRCWFKSTSKKNIMLKVLDRFDNGFIIIMSLVRKA